LGEEGGNNEKEKKARGVERYILITTKHRRKGSCKSN